MKIKKILKDEKFIIFMIISLLMGLTYFRVDKFYDKLLKDSKYQIYKKDAPRR